MGKGDNFGNQSLSEEKLGSDLNEHQDSENQLIAHEIEDEAMLEAKL